MDSDVLKFNGKQSDAEDLGIELWRRWDRPIIAGTRDHIGEIVGRDGALDFGYDLQAIEIPCAFIVAADSVQALRSQARAIAQWLHVAEPKELIFGDEQGKYYMARPLGSVDLTELITTGEGEVTFYVPEGCAFSDTTKTADGYPVDNEGTLACPVIIAYTMPENSFYLTLYFSDEPHTFQLLHDLQAGDEVTVDTAKKTVTVNGTDATADITFKSEWIKMPPGEHTCYANHEGTDGVPTITFRERYL